MGGGRPKEGPFYVGIERYIFDSGDEGNFRPHTKLLLKRGSFICRGLLFFQMDVTYSPRNLDSFLIS